MHCRPATILGLVLANAGVSFAQTGIPNLSGFLSAAQGIASALDITLPTQSPTARSTFSSVTTSSSSSSSSSLTSSSTPTSAPSTNTASPAAATSTGVGSGANSDSSGLDPHTRNIILGVTIPIGLLILAAIILAIVLCCRRRRRTSRAPSPESKFVGNKDWEHGDAAHHGFNSSSSLRTGHSIGNGVGTHHDAAPLMGAVHPSDRAMSEHHSGPTLIGRSLDPVTKHYSTNPVMATNHHHSTGPAMAANHHSMNPAMATNHHHSIGPAMVTNHHHSTGPAMATNPFEPTGLEPTAYRHSNGNADVQNPFTPVPPISRKPVPNRDSTGSNISAISGHQQDHRHSALKTGAVVGAGALAGAAAMHHHDKHRRSDTSQHRPESIHRPLGSHPSQNGMYATAGPMNDHPYQRRGSTPPFSPDDVGSMHRTSQRFSHEQSELIPPVPQTQPDEVRGGIIAPTASQRRSLQSRNSSYSDGRDVSRGPSRSPKRRSLSGGGEMWQADTVPPPAIPTQSRHNSGDFQFGNTAAAVVPPNRSSLHSEELRHTGPAFAAAHPNRSRDNSGEFQFGNTAAAVMPPNRSSHHSEEVRHPSPAFAAARPNRSRHNSGESRYSNPVRAPALPSNRHIGRSRQPHLYDTIDATNTDSSTSNDSWESAQADLDPWNDHDTGRYPRFSGGSTNSNAPLMPPPAKWNDDTERRWSGDIFNRESGKGRGYTAEPRRYSNGMERRKLRFSEGEPEYYNEQGLVGRAL